MYDILEGYNAFPSYNQKFKKSEIEIFPKGLTHGFGPRMAIFPSFLLKQYRRGRFIWQYSATIKRFSRLYKQEVKKSKNWNFSKRVNPWFWSKNGHFSKFFFLGNIQQENVFYDILQRYSAFLGYKTRNSQRSKNWDFSKGVNPWFSSTKGHFSIVLI